MVTVGSGLVGNDRAVYVTAEGVHHSAVIVRERTAPGVVDLEANASNGFHYRRDSVPYDAGMADQTWHFIPNVRLFLSNPVTNEDAHAISLKGKVEM